MHELKRSNAVELLHARKRAYESQRTKDSGFKLREEVLVSQNNFISDTLLEFANNEKADLIVIGNFG